MAADGTTGNESSIGQHNRVSAQQRSPIGQLDRQRRREREEWLSQWSHIWTKRQSPEWKPRRASVASCQQQQQSYTYNLTDNTSLRKLLSQHSHNQRRHLEANCCIPSLLSNAIKVDHHHHRNQQQQQSHHSDLVDNTTHHAVAATDEQIVIVDRTKTVPHTNIRCHESVSPTTTYNKTTTTQSGTSNGEGQSKTRDGKLSQDLTLCSQVVSAATAAVDTTTAAIATTTTTAAAAAASSTDHEPSSISEITGATGQQLRVRQLNRSSLDSYLPNRAAKDLQLAATCCSDLPSVSSPLPGKLANSADDVLGVEMNEKLQLQDKQRKFLIFSMALKQLISEGSFTTVHECCNCRSNNCTTSSCSSSTATTTTTTGIRSSSLQRSNEKTRARYQKHPAKSDSRIVLNSSRSALIDRLQVSAATAPTTTTCCHVETASQKLQLNKSRGQTSELAVKKVNKDCSISGSSSSRSSSSGSSGDGYKFQQADIPESPPKPGKREEVLKVEEGVGKENRSKGEVSSCCETITTMSASSYFGSKETDTLQATQPNNNKLNICAGCCYHSTVDSCCNIEQKSSDVESEPEYSDQTSSNNNKTTMRRDHPSARHSTSTTTIRSNSFSPQNRIETTSRCLDKSTDNANCDLNLESLIVESWLDDHPSFVQDYFMRKATHQLIDDWLITRAKVNSTNFGSQMDLTSQVNLMSRQVSQHSLNSHLHNLSSRASDSDQPQAKVQQQQQQQQQQTTTLEHQQQYSGGGSRTTTGNIGSSYQSARSSSQSGAATPVRKISATDFESRTGNGFLRPMVSTTPDGRPTFLSKLSACDDDDDCFRLMPYQHAKGLDNRKRSSGNESSLSSSNNNKQVATSTLVRREMGERRNSVCDTEDLDEDEDENENDDSDDNDDESVKRERGEEERDIEEEEDNNNEEDQEEKKLTREVKLIFELVKNICNDLDIRTLLHKILKNIAVLINADKSSLFLVCGEIGDSNRHLVSHLFNVDQDAETPMSDQSSDCITIPWGTGLVGYVAESGESLNIANCYEDPRFTNTVDQRTGYVTRHMLCAPIFDKRNEIVGVAQVINKRDGKPFSKSDEIKFKRYLQFCGIGLRNAQSYEHCQLENRRNQVLLDLARMVFEEQSTIEQVVYRIMLHTQSLLECQRCQVLLIDDGSDDLDQLLQLPNSSQQEQWQQRHKQHQGETITTTASEAAEPQPPEWQPQCNTSQPGLPMSGVHQVDGSHDQNDQDYHHNNNNNNDNREHHQMDSIGGVQTTLQQSPKLFSLVFDLECDGNDLVVHSSSKDEKLLADGGDQISAKSMVIRKNRHQFPINIGITGYVARTGETLNIEDAYQCERFDPSVDEGSNFKHKSILCMPIRNGQRQIIGVSQLINKKNGRPFNKNDEDLFEAFAIFCGLGIHNTLMYEKVLKIMAKQRVTFEVLSYHATAPLEEAKKLNLEMIPSCFALNLTSLKFNDFSLDDQFMLKSCLRFFLDLDLIRRFNIDQLVFCNWILSVQKNYRKVTYHPIVASSPRSTAAGCSGGNGLKATPVRYHNWRHAFNVSQMMFAILINTQICQALGELETLALLIACLCHDLDHRGTNNSFQIKSASPLADLYSTSTMEHHHFDQCVMILNSQGNQILANLSPEEYSRVIVLLEEAILATDLANYFQKRELFFQLVNTNQFEWHNNPEHRSILRCMLMTACDVAAITKPWPVQKVVADLVMSEFYQQGDIEKHELNIEPIDMMNREKMSKLPEMQIGFIDSICAPIYTAFAKLFPRELSPLLEGCLSNRNLWAEMAKNKDVHSDTPLISYLNNNSTPITILPKNNTSLSEVNMNQIGESDIQEIPPDENSGVSCFLTSNLIEPRPVTASERQFPKVDCQRKSV